MGTVASVNKSLNRASNLVFEESRNRPSLVKCFLILPVCGTFTVVLMVGTVLLLCVFVCSHLCVRTCVCVSLRIRMRALFTFVDVCPTMLGVNTIVLL